MEEMRKTVFITGTTNKELIKEVVTLLDYLGYDALYGIKNDIDDDEKNIRIKGILESDGLLYYGNIGGKYQDIYKQEFKIAKYLELPVIFYKRTPIDLSELTETLESLVTKKVLRDAMEKEEENNEDN